MEDNVFIWQNPKLGDAEIACLEQICKLLDPNNIPTKEAAETVKMLAEAVFALERTVELMY